MASNANEDTLQARYAKIPVLNTAEIEKIESQLYHTATNIFN